MDLPDLTSTIVALSSPKGSGRRAIVRLSGADSRKLGEALIAEDCAKHFASKEKTAFLATLKFEDWQAVPALILWMPAPKSYTREDVLEIHIPASNPFTQALIRKILALGARSAIAGEFTLRAFLNGRINASQVENIGKIINAKTKEQAKAYAQKFTTALADRIKSAERKLIEIVSTLEFYIDFDETEDAEPDFAFIKMEIRKLADSLRKIYDNAILETLDDLPLVVFAGATNAGKSSLFNKLLGQRKALITAKPRTTRDFLLAPAHIADVNLYLADTAGFFDELNKSENAQINSQDNLDKAGKFEAEKILAKADVVIFCTETSENFELLLDLQKQTLARETPVIVCLTKADEKVFEIDEKALAKTDVQKIIRTSVITDVGIEELKSEIAKALRQTETTSALQITAREQTLLKSAFEMLDAIADFPASLSTIEIFVEELRLATKKLSEISGTELEPEVLTNLFANFCIGK